MVIEIIENVVYDDIFNCEIYEQFGCKYLVGFIIEIELDFLLLGLDEDIICVLLVKKDELEWMMQWCLDVYCYFLIMLMLDWVKLEIVLIDLQVFSYYFVLKGLKYVLLDDVLKELFDIYDKLGVLLYECVKLVGVVVDVVFDLVFVGIIFCKELVEKGIIFCLMFEVIKEYLELVCQYLGIVVLVGDNYFVVFNLVVFFDGSFVFIFRGVCCLMELSIYFCINVGYIGQFECILIVCEDKVYVFYLEGCIVLMCDENQLYVVVVELVVLEDVEIKYFIVQNWYLGDENGVGGIYNFVIKCVECRGVCSKVIWIQVEIGLVIIWKYFLCVLLGDDLVGEFYLVVLIYYCQQVDIGIKMIYVGKCIKSKIVSKGISVGRGQNIYCGLVCVDCNVDGVCNYIQCDLLLIGKQCGVYIFFYIEVKNLGVIVEYEVIILKIFDDQLFYCCVCGISQEDVVLMIVDGFCKQVFCELLMEFVVEVKKLLEVLLEGLVG